MLDFYLDGELLQAEEGQSILKAARANGHYIPSMCFNEHSGHKSSCMVCAVKEQKSGAYIPACSTMVRQSMQLESESDEVRRMRRYALDFILHKHAGDCYAPCEEACPFDFDIPTFLRMTANGKYEEAARSVKMSLPFEGEICKLCPAYCERACLRQKADEAVNVKGLVGYISGNVPSGSGAAKDGQLKGREIFFDCSNVESILIAAELAKHGAMVYLNGDKDDCVSKLEERVSVSVSGALAAKSLDITCITFRQEGHGGKDGRYRVYFISEPSKRTGLIMKHDKMFEINRKNIEKESDFFTQYKEAYKHAREIKSHIISSGSYKNSRGFVSRAAALSAEEIKGLFLGSAAIDRSDNISGSKPLDEASRCMQCGCMKKGGCVLKGLASLYGASGRRFTKKRKTPVKRETLYGSIVYERGKCLLCGRCVIEEGGKAALELVGRGNDMRLSVPMSGFYDEPNAESLRLAISRCPTGALYERYGEDG